MATVNVAEFSQPMTVSNGVVQLPSGTPMATYDIEIGSNSAQGAVFQDATKMIRVNCGAACRMAMGSDPVAGSTSMRYTNGATEFWGVPQPGMRLAVIQTS